MHPLALTTLLTLPLTLLPATPPATPQATPIAPPTAALTLPTAPTLLAALAAPPPAAAGHVDRKVGRQVAPTGDFGWPLAGFPVVVRGFDPPDTPYGRGHRGVDLSGSVGQQVLAAGTGIVVFVGQVAGRPVISVDHPNGLRTTYEPVAATVTTGQRVTRGDPIGTLQPGHPDCTAAACLHWGVRRGDEYLDPLGLLGAGPVRLLPTTETT